MSDLCTASEVVFLKGSPALLHERMQTRRGHYMKEGMLTAKSVILERTEGRDYSRRERKSANDVVRECAASAGRGGWGRSAVRVVSRRARAPRCFRFTERQCCMV